jgi:ATP-binding cassette subfamily G (WHITE) protein 2 (SNQ2)
MAETPADAATLYEEKRTDEREIRSLGSKPSRDIDVIRAEEEFNALSRQLSAPSEVHRKRSELSTTTVGSGDVEKGGKAPENSEQFDLREYLSSSNDANQQAGIKHKVRRGTLLPADCHMKLCCSMLELSGRICKLTSLVDGIIR